MRTLTVCLILLFPCMQAAVAAPAPAADPIVPVLTLTIQPPILKINSNYNSSALAGFNGTAAVDKMPGVRCVVTLTSATDIGWVSQISPSTLVFTNEAPQSYTVAVDVPAGTPTSTGNLKVNGRAVAIGLQSTAEVTAIIDVTGTVRANLTAQNRTGGNTTRAAATAGGGPDNLLMYSAVAMVLIAAPAVGIVLYRRRRSRSVLPE